MPPTDQLIFSFAFISFFAGLAVAYTLAHRPLIRKSFLTGFVTLLIIVNILGIAVLPLVSLHKFSTPDDQTIDYHSMHVVDEDGNELYVDHHALDPKLPYSVRSLAGKMVTEYNRSKTTNLSCFVINQADQHRSEILMEGAPSMELGDFPPHDIQPHWSESAVTNVSEFNTLRIYRESVTSSEDGASVINQEKELVYEFKHDEGDQCPQ